MLISLPKSQAVIKRIIRKMASVHSAEGTTANRIKAWQIHSYGDLSELQLSEANVPVVQNPDDVLVKVEAAAINPFDRSITTGYGKQMLAYMRGYEFEFPLTPGRDFAGTVIDKGHNVGDEFMVDDAVYGALAPYKQGSLAEIIVCNKDMVCHRPKNVSPVEAASIAYAAMTGWSALFLTGGLGSKYPLQCRVLILGASGGVGTLAVQMLKAQGATVVGTCSSDAVPMVKSLGADLVFDYRDKDYISNVGAAGTYDIILDCAKFGYQNVPDSWVHKQFITLTSPLLRNSDAYGFYGGLAVSVKDILRANIPRFFQGKSVKWAFFSSNKDGLKFITKLIEEGKITPMIHKVFKFNEVPQAFQALSDGHLRGKIAIDFSS